MEHGPQVLAMMPGGATPGFPGMVNPMGAMAMGGMPQMGMPAVSPYGIS